MQIAKKSLDENAPESGCGGFCDEDNIDDGVQHAQDAVSFWLTGKAGNKASNNHEVPVLDERKAENSIASAVVSKATDINSQIDEALDIIEQLTPQGKRANKGSPLKKAVFDDDSDVEQYIDRFPETNNSGEKRGRTGDQDSDS